MGAPATAEMIVVAACNYTPLLRTTKDASLIAVPAFLVDASGLNSGYMMVQVTSAALVSECKTLAHPASVDSIPTGGGIEDHVSMAPIAARHARVEKMVRAALPKRRSILRKASGLRSATMTLAPMPSAIVAACVTTTPPPRMTTSAAGTPGTPASRTPRASSRPSRRNNSKEFTAENAEHAERRQKN